MGLTKKKLQQAHFKRKVELKFDLYQPAAPSTGREALSTEYLTAGLRPEPFARIENHSAVSVGGLMRHREFIAFERPEDYDLLWNIVKAV
ncbi:hypothetical protein EVAR_71170_1 [Eumeta japonica]|uniref:Uncharacterized protein n=1 Tax=Eumeta variegata TaxID=151549 RepID=A0A4C1ZPD2_EUMVA|nr:hypothetical protein EVAR_71170_1 [Eumeta japonica]